VRDSRDARDFRDSRGPGLPGPPPDGLVVSGCQHATVGGIVCGEYAVESQNHGKPVYRKTKQVNGLDVMLYYWDERDGQRFSGWWFGPKVGGEQIWAYHPEKGESAPPTSGWQVPFGGPVDPTFMLSPKFSHGAGHSSPGGGALGFRREDERPRPERGREEQRQREEARRREEEFKRRREEDQRRRREEEEKRRLEEEARRASELQRRREEEERQRQQQLQEDMERKRQTQQEQQKAALAIRRVITKVRSATPDTFDALKRELEETLQRELDNCGSQRQRVAQESQEGLEQGRRKVEQDASRQYALVMHNEMLRQDRENKLKQIQENKKLVEEQNRQRLEEQRQRVQEARRQQQEEAERKAQEAQQQREVMERKRKEVEEKRRLQNKSTLEIRKAIQKVRLAKDGASLEQLKSDLENALREELDNTGTMKQQLRDESSHELEQLEWRLENQRKEQQKKEASIKIVEDLEQLVDAAESSLQKLLEATAPLEEKSELSVEDVEKAMVEVEESAAVAQTAAMACADFVKAKGWEVKDWDAKQSMGKLQRRSTLCTQSLECAVTKAQQAREAAVHCAQAWQQTREIQGIFFKYGSGEMLSRKEVLTYAKRELKFTIPEETLNTIWQNIVAEGERGVKLEAFHLLKAHIGIARELERDQKRRAEREEKERVFQKVKAELQRKAKDAAKPVDSADKDVSSVEKQVKPLAAKAKTMASRRMIALADGIDKMIEDAKASVDAARSSIEGLSDDYDERFKEDIKAYLKAETKQLELRLGRMDLRIVRATNLSTQFRERVADRREAEVQRIHKAVRLILQHNRDLKELTSEELFDEIDTDGNKAIDEGEFLAFFERADRDVDLRLLEREPSEAGAAAAEEAEDRGEAAAATEAAAGEEGEAGAAAQEAVNPEEAEAEAEAAAEEEEEEQVDLSPESLSAAFACLLEDGSSGISKEDFARLLRMHYRVVKTTAITDARSLKDSRTLRRLEVHEVVEVLRGPMKEGAHYVMRIRARVLKDNLEGWITTSGNLGTLFLKESSNLFKVTKETILTDSFDVAHSKDSTQLKVTTRKLKPGELLQVYEWPRKHEESGLVRMKAKAKSDGAVGWVTTTGNQGTTFAVQAEAPLQG